MEINLEAYQKHFALESAKFVRIDHANTIIAVVYKVVTSDKNHLF